MFSRDVSNSAPLFVCGKATGGLRNTPSANDSKVHKQEFNSLPFFNNRLEVRQRLGRDIISVKPSVFPRRPSGRGAENKGAALIPKRGKRPIFVAGILVQLGRPLLSLEPGASTGLFFITPTEAPGLRYYLFLDNRKLSSTPFSHYPPVVVCVSRRKEHLKPKGPVLFSQPSRHESPRTITQSEAAYWVHCLRATNATVWNKCIVC